MPADKKITENCLDKGENDRTAALVREILTEMETMTPEELERLYAVVALMDKKGQDTTGG